MHGQLQASRMGQGIEILLADAGWRRTGGIAPPTQRLFRPLGDVVGLPKERQGRPEINPRE